MRNLVERLDDLIKAADLMERLAQNSLEYSRGDLVRFAGVVPKYERQARLRAKGAARLRKSAAKLCDQIKERLNNETAGRPDKVCSLIL